MIKVQAAYRRFHTMKQLERQNRTTSHMRNQMRRRKAKQSQSRSIFSQTMKNNDNKSMKDKNMKQSDYNQSQKQPSQYTIHQQPDGGHDIPFLFRCCGVGLMFGDSTEENYLITKQHEKENYQNHQKERYEKEEYLRQHYGKSLKQKVQHNFMEQEAYEVVE